MTNHKYVCIHGHFYQPPRENPWLEEIEEQPSAFPYHDWNERITQECYAPNSHAKIINHEGHHEYFVNNYEKISFNFGPTLLSWMTQKHPQVLRSIIEADQWSQHHFNGHGNAIAQTYHHMIMPLANYQDKLTEIIWGIQSFEHYFQRKPEGLWLPETAVDLETLDLMQQAGIKFTILSPTQAYRIRPLGQTEWTYTLETGQPYLQRLPSGNSMILFFYEGNIAKAVAFEHLLDNGENFAQRLIHSLPEDHTQRLMHIATDGETYGHHHAFGDMSLAYALQCLDHSNDITITNYAQFIDIHPPEFEVEIHTNSSWSCAHGIERWRNPCGCCQNQAWQQTWRAPLREAMDWLRDEMAAMYDQEAGVYLKNPWQARNDYIQVVHQHNFEQFIREQAHRNLNQEEKVRVLQWCELQRYALSMYTSCGWFFDEISGLETVQILRYAGRCIGLVQQLVKKNLEQGLTHRLTMAPSNLKEYGDGAHVYEHFVKPYLVR